MSWVATPRSAINWADINWDWLHHSSSTETQRNKRWQLAIKKASENSCNKQTIKTKLYVGLSSTSVIAHLRLFQTRNEQAGNVDIGQWQIFNYKLKIMSAFGLNVSHQSHNITNKYRHVPCVFTSTQQNPPSFLNFTLIANKLDTRGRSLILWAEPRRQTMIALLTRADIKTLARDGRLSQRAFVDERAKQKKLLLTTRQL